jgi:hypothetical protein
MKPPKVISPKWLRDHNFCEQYVEPFEYLFHKGLPFTEESVERIRNFDFPVPSPDADPESFESQDYTGKRIIAEFVHGCVQMNLSDDPYIEQEYRIKGKAIKQLEGVMYTKKLGYSPEALIPWALKASPKEIIHFCTWAMLNWKRK